MFSLPLGAQEQGDVTVSKLDELLGQLKTAESVAEADLVLRQIQVEWSKSGSPSMDLLLSRGRDALERGDLMEAVEHLTALTDHAPEFAEGWHARAMAFYRQELFGMAAADLERTLLLNPNHFGAIRGIGAIHEHLGQPDLAWRAYKLAQDFHPQDEEIQQALDRLSSQAVGLDI